MRIAIIQFPGSNCERETMLAVKRAGMEPVNFYGMNQRKISGLCRVILLSAVFLMKIVRVQVIAALIPSCK